MVINSLQVTAGTKKANRVNKAEAGHFAKAGVEAGVVCGNSALTIVKVRTLKLAA